MDKYIFPKRAFTDKEISNCNLLKKQPLQIGLAEKNTTLFCENEYVILDFGEELCGGIRILTYTAKNIPVRIRFGESFTEACSELGGKNNATNDHSLRDLTVNLQNYSDMVFGQTGFRYVRLDFAGKVEIKSIVAAIKTVKRNALYVYEGSDARIRQIYDVAKR